MAKLEISITINRPIEEVFAFMSDPENQLLWRSGLVEIEQTSEGPIGMGTTYREVMQFLGRRIENTGEIAEYELNKRNTVKTTSGPVPMEITSTFQPVEGGTEVTYGIDAELSGFFRLAEPLVVRMGKRQMEMELVNLKELMEAQA